MEKEEFYGKGSKNSGIGEILLFSQDRKLRWKDIPTM